MTEYLGRRKMIIFVLKDVMTSLKGHMFFMMYKKE